MSTTHANVIALRRVTHPQTHSNTHKQTTIVKRTVEADTAVEHGRVLSEDKDRRPQLPEGNGGEIDPVDCNPPACQRHKPEQHLRQR